MCLHLADDQEGVDRYLRHCVFLVYLSGIPRLPLVVPLLKSSAKRYLLVPVPDAEGL